MKKNVLMTAVVTAFLIGGATTARAEKPKPQSEIIPPAGQNPPPDKAHQPAPQKPDGGSRTTNAPGAIAGEDGKREKPESKHSKDSKGKVTINHKGHVIEVSEHALKGHLAHGDTVVSDGTSGKKHKEHGKDKDKSK